MACWTHRSTWRDFSPTDRVVLRDGVVVARIERYPHGPQKGRWSWAVQWITPENCGTAGTLAEALHVVRTRYRAEAPVQLARALRPIHAV